MWLSLGVDLVCLCKGLYFIVTEGSSKEFEFDEGDLVENVEAIFVASVQRKLEEAAGNAEVYRLQFARLVTGLLVRFQRKVTESLKD